MASEAPYLLVCGYLAQNVVRYGDPLARTATQHYLEADGGLGTVFSPYVVSDPFRYVIVVVPHKIVESFWYESGWNQFLVVARQLGDHRGILLRV